MSATSPERPVRRAASRKKLMAETRTESDIENNVENSLEDNANKDDDEYSSIPIKSHRTSPRRTTMSETAVSPRSRNPGGRRTNNNMGSIGPSQIFSPPESVIEEPLSPSKKPAPQRRSVKDARATRRSRAARISIAADATEDLTTYALLPTPEATASPEPDQSNSVAALADITESVLNESNLKTEPQSPRTTINEMSQTLEHDITQTPKTVGKIEVEKVDVNVTRLEKPMDIVIRSRATGAIHTAHPEAPKQRMTITYLILNNFKSYAGKQVVGPFHASFSSVVGPNGSGKSNVIDSLLFVFGFRASKMRQGKISALIHNSVQFPNLDHCEVQVHFQEVEDVAQGGHVVVPGSTLIISRKAFKNNSSKYYINGRESSFTVVTTLLKDKGVDLDHKRFLILQGEVESIAQMKPKALNDNDDGLLEYLEDIIGTSKFKSPIEEAATETESLNEVCLEKSSRVQHVEKEKNGLETKRDKALAYVRDENELAVKQSTLYQIYVAECNDNITVTEEASNAIRENLDEEAQKHRVSEDQIQQIAKQYKAKAKEHEQLEKQTEIMLQDIARLDKESVKLEEKKKFLSTKAKKLEKAVESSKFSIHESERLASQADADILRLKDQVEGLEAEMTEEEQELTRIRQSLRGKTQGLSDDIAAKQKQLEPWITKVNQKQSAKAVAQSELDILRERENAGAAAVAELESKLALLQEQRTSKNSLIVKCVQDCKSLAKEIQEAKKHFEVLSSQEPSLKMKVSGARQKADEARASLSTSQSQGNVLTGLTRLQESGRIDGFHGRLGNLGAIDGRYDVAISTACPALDHLVVENVEVGQQCIDYLRKNNLGRANFILLDRLQKRELTRIDTPENVPRLFDLVKSKHDRFCEAFYSVLQNTLVAQDLEQANRIAYGSKRWRVVTLDGQLIDKSGTMSGGGTRVARGAMSSKVASAVSKDQVVKLEADQDVLEREHDQLAERIQEAHSHLKLLQEKEPKLQTEAQKLNLELESIDRDILDSKKRHSELGAETKPSTADRARVTKLAGSIEIYGSEIEQLQSEMVDLENEIQALQDRIMEVGGVQLRAQKAKVDGLKEQIEALHEAMSAAEVSKVKATKQSQKQRSNNDDATSTLATITQDLEQLQTAVQRHFTDTSAFRREAEQAEVSLEERREELRTLSVHLDDQRALLNDSRSLELELRNKLDEHEKILADNVKRLQYWQEKLSKLGLQTLDECGELKQLEKVPEMSRDELADEDKERLKGEIAALEERTSQPVELAVLGEYRRREIEHASRLEDLTFALGARDTAKQRTDELRRLRLEGFMEGFSIISMRLKEMYQMITMGGNAELELVDSLDPFSEGILFSVMPPKKSWKNIGNLSGGEKTLSSLALVFALHHYRPTPLYVMDEIDAALDFRNVSIVAAYIKERTKNAQFIVISLRNNMFELASRLVGVYKVNHMTKSVTVENKDYVNTPA